MKKVYLSIGSNLNAEMNMQKVKRLLDDRFDVTYSRVYASKAEGFEGEDFLNSVCFFYTDLKPLELTRLLKDIEKSMGRNISQKGMSNRCIDLDLIIYGEEIIKTDELDIPSDDIEKYKFVLEPLCELAPDEIHPIIKLSYKEIRENIELS
tara:strand:- start:140 stop:592 length:453 start_codon:yes stop_codon:yes gene_type:complete